MGTSIAPLAAAVVLVLAGCGSPVRVSSSSKGVGLPDAIVVEDGAGGALRLHLRPVVPGYGWRGHAMGGGAIGRHRGIDIVAPAGTPVRAAGVGTIVELGTRGAYGRIIVVRHSDRIDTAYAHLSRFATDLTVGRWVQQDEVIGYVGSTGRSNGPHLHYELRRDGRAVDPLGFPPARARRSATP